MLSVDQVKTFELINNCLNLMLLNCKLKDKLKK